LPITIQKKNAPILVPKQGCSWADTMVLNPAMIPDPENPDCYHMLFRATGPYPEKRVEGQPLPYPIFLGYAVSHDRGETWDADFENPALAPTLNMQKDAIKRINRAGEQVVNHANGCIEDPRLFPFEGGLYLTTACRMFPPGPYWENDKLSHRCGSTTIASINFGSAPDISPSGNDSLWIPGFYTPRIDDPATRTAATNALYVYVTNRLTTVGDTILIIDYEPMWNYDTTTTTGRTLFSDWFIDAAAVARRAADDIGMSDLLQIAINVNGNPIWAPEIVGGTNATWLLDAAAAADIFTIDTYSFDSNDPTNAAVTFSVLEYWIEHYSLGKPVIVTEVGFQTVLTEDPDYAGGYHAYGTEEQQAQFYENFFQTLETENVPGGQLKGQVRGVALWSFMDQDFGSYLDYFGLVRTNSTLKPAAAVVQSNLTLNADGAVRPSFEGPVVLYTGMTITNEMPLVFDSGTEHGFLRLSGMLPAGAHTVSLHVETAGPGHMMLCANGDWTPPAHTPKSSFDFNLSGAALPGETNTLDLFFTGDFFPCTQTVSRVSLSYSGPIQLALDYAVEMMTVEATGLPAIGTNYLQATTNLVDGEWSPIDFSTGAEVEEWTVSPNVAPVRFFRVLSVQ